MAVVKVICKNLKANPQCPHGPTLRFVRVQDGRELEFYACSTYRDRKDCGFYLAVGDKCSERLADVWELERKKLQPTADHATSKERLYTVKQVPPTQRLYCHTCSVLDTLSQKHQHRDHQVQTVITDAMLAHPSKLLKPKEGSKKEAQYFFEESTTKVIVDNLLRARVSRVLCLGMPRVHEYVQANCGDKLSSLLLDLDHRYSSFWPPEKFVWYNMFNRHVFGEGDEQKKGRATLRNHLTTDGPVGLLMDPPFGGHVDPLSATLKHFSKTQGDKELLVIWVFPYFRERHILEKCPTLRMLDYKVQYDNHKDFNKGHKVGSPVRLFTNIPARQFVLPKSEGYRLCHKCDKWVSAENKHCVKCGCCPSKDGRTYVHCDTCGCCVKPQWQHCLTCLKCLPPHHLCADKINKDITSGKEEPRHKRAKLIGEKLKIKKKRNYKKFKTKIKK